MQTAVQRLYSAGEGEAIVTDRFEIIEQAQDCRRLFEQLEHSLASGWEQYYQAAALYKAEHGDLLIPKRYVTPEGLTLGRWIVTQRRVRSGRTPGTLTESPPTILADKGISGKNGRLSRPSRSASHRYRSGILPSL